MRIVAALAILVLFGAGVAAASTISGSTVSVCATATTPAHTVAVDGTPIDTIPGDTATQCVTTTAASGPTFASETAYTQSPPSFTPVRTISVSDASGLKSAIANLQPGDLVQASVPFTVSGSAGNALTISNRLSAPAEINLTGVSVVYTGTADYAAIFIDNPSNVRIFGGSLSMSQPTVGGGSCITWYGGQHDLWWGFDAHDCGSGGVSVTSTRAFHYPVEYDDIEGTIHHFSLNGGLFDSHLEKCSGIHGANLADSNTAVFDHNRFAFNVSDSACSGGGIEFGSAQASPTPDSNTIILQCDSLTFMSKIQTGGNCYQTWGYGETNTDIKYLVASNLAGHPYYAGGMYGGASLSTDTVEYGRATNVRQNPRYVNDPNWDATGGTVFEDVA